MKIIDAHIHFSDREHFAQTALLADHKNEVSHLERAFAKNGVVFAVAMGAGRAEGEETFGKAQGIDLAGKLNLEEYNQPPWVCYCCGIPSEALTKQNMREALDSAERHLKSKHCVGMKIYPGYHPVYLWDERHIPFFELAQSYDVPVVVHTGDTANSRALLKYSHPLTVDEAAVKFPRVRFVMAHFGNPWIVDATEVAKKNDNVFIDLSGLAAGNFEADWFLEHYRGYVEHLKTWMTYLGAWEKLLYGSDWPLVNLDSYMKLMKTMVPEKYHEGFFFQNALRVFPKIAPLLDSLEKE